MNERIGKLAEQAGLLGPTSRVGNSHEATVRFAELIVRECLEACRVACEIKHPTPPSQQQVVWSCMREIEETFRS